ncbi:putative single-stranded DNA-binding protein [Escherichia coli]|nr:putative single-stranded DNA-binding protein [Escherichia coli]
MTAQISVYGRLVDDPQTKQTSKGTPMTLARMAVSLCLQSVG